MSGQCRRWRWMSKRICFRLRLCPPLPNLSLSLSLLFRAATSLPRAACSLEPNRISHPKLAPPFPFYILFPPFPPRHHHTAITTALPHHHVATTTATSTALRWPSLLPRVMFHISIARQLVWWCTRMLRGRRSGRTSKTTTPSWTVSCLCWTWLVGKLRVWLLSWPAGGQTIVALLSCMLTGWLAG